MPIQFRCSSCNQKLAITRRKAGKVVKCPACAADLEVPTLEEAAATGQLVDTPEQPPAPSPPIQESPSSPEAQYEETSQLDSDPPHDAYEDVPAGVFEDLDSYDDNDEDAFDEDPAIHSAAIDAESEAGAPLIGDGAASHWKDAAQADALHPHRSLASTERTWIDDEDDEEEGFHLGRRSPDESGLDMTPMVDVTFLLLIFFMITASFSVQKSMETEAPEPDDEGAAQMPSMEDLADDSVIVEIDESDTIYVDDVQVASIPELIDALALKVSGEQKLEMIIEPHPLAKHGTVVQATDAGIEVGMQRIRRGTRKGE